MTQIPQRHFPAAKPPHAKQAPPNGCQPGMPVEMTRRVWQDCRGQSLSGRPRTVYLHFPFCKKRCDFCPFFINRYNRQNLDDYVEAVVREIALTAAQPGLRATPIRAVYFGGGTPSDLRPDDVARIVNALHRHFPLAGDCEITMEARIHGSSGALARTWIDAGINRISLGVQTFDTRLRELLGRIEARERVLEVLDELTALPGATVNIDLLYGLPGQSVGDLIGELQTITSATNLHGFYLYHLKLFPGSPLDAAIREGKLPKVPSLREKEAFYAAATRWLEGTDYWQLSTCHWIKDPRERSRYNQLAKGRTDIIPLGSGAGGRINNHQFFQSRGLGDYLRLVGQNEKPLMMAAQRDEHAPLKDTISHEFEHGHLSRRTRHNLAVAMPKALRLLERWERLGLLEPSPTQRHAYRLSTRGRFWSPEMLTHLSRGLAEGSRLVRGHHF